MTTTAAKLAELREKLELAREPAGDVAIAKRAKKGIPSARERIDMLLDPGSFVEIGALVRAPGSPDSLYGDGVVTGHGTVDGRPIAVFSHDQTVFGGTVGEMFGRKVALIMEFAADVGCPCVGINDSGGARVQDAVTSLAWYAELGRRQEPLSGMCPQISVVLGKCAGGAVYAPINTDIIVATEEAYMFVTGPDVIKSVTGEDVSLHDLGSARKQAEYGNVHHVAQDEKAAFEWVRKYLSYLPSNCHEKPPIINPGLEPTITDDDRALDSFMPDSDNAGYDMHEVLLRIFDDGDFHELTGQTALNIIVGFARVDGRPVGVVANQPMHLSGALDAASSDKASHFINICNAFEIPLVLVTDTPGFMPGLEQEKIGVIKRGGRFIFSYVSASVPKLTVVIRKSYGGGYAVMGSKQLGADINFAWPTARIAVMGAEGAVSIMARRQLAEAGDNAPAIRQGFIDFYNEHVATPWIAAERGYVDAVIEPSSTRLEIRKALHLLRDKVREPRPRKQYLFPV
ncbi:acyl-CoA carboxylase subunit beta [Rhodococcus sp. BP-349]|uniref:acyl-CoA carboxylase subunit beta n=1 Tax=unclassified Rhodococcus (in: high G+C Gram-positive bacteria) TaxID=192944 RepID=UPI001C9A3F5F|nr:MULTISPECIES: acyl-CoA carboxylase subunit beta [unclassified Rhodococcus (in: high G+C Gram-positive bacteria)]MBY6537068.1 acyl-CoA carboxylase subunit beta [Rhodococcus sp. BP-363]MBY6541405.1 acyl-CoA carboxylase subunit beta [Rhodococcus sp. BP-369]MBY6560635.1 acyl-CoA carboxylase subunit beta [Rhodococcus sp. BP-370]MBY6574927.1 acyl-CoA carboxylase subunit beta [Rhodococcus sp. BP-364]MBY6584228.1 acyl-CoA carboxylase subunit beta [Rhodococcus sp. BP-358]